MASSGAQNQRLNIDPNRWEEIERIFQSATDLPSEQRSAFIEERCRNDQALKTAVKILVASFEDAGDFIEEPPFRYKTSHEDRVGEITNIQSIATGPVSRQWEAGLAVGRTIHQYQLLSLLGAGGMGEVYLAHDSHLNRRVAVKLLPPQFTSKDQHVQRFASEARSASALNHPNIITIHEIGQVDDTHFIATEFIEGQTLRELLRTRQLSLEQMIDVAAQIAGALYAAHCAGIIHRDIKPENIMVRPDGLVKVLDFGLAKSPAPETDTGKTTSSSIDANSIAMLGTINYLSPEQIECRVLDHRTDIFSLGIVLYEMVAGKRPFSGSSVAATLDAILTDEPPPIQAPPSISKVIKRALAKKPESRYQNTGDLREDLRRIKLNHGLSLNRTGLILVASALLILVVIVGAVAYRQLRFRPINASSIPILETRYIRQTAGAGIESSPSLSSDGSKLIYASRAKGDWDIFIQPLRHTDSDTLPEPVNLTGDSPDDDTQPAFSPDGSQIVFRSQRDGGGIFIMSVNGGTTKKIAESGYTPIWSTDGTEIIISSADGQEGSSRTPAPSSVEAVNIQTREHRTIVSGDAVQPACSPHGQRIAFWGMRQGGQRDIWTVGLAGGTPVEVTNDVHCDWNPVWSADGAYLYFASDRDGKMNLWRIQIDETSGLTKGKPQPVQLPGDYIQHFNFSPDGRLMTYVQKSIRKNLYHLGFDSASGSAIGQAVSLNQGSMLFSSPDISPDGEWIVFTNQGEKQEDLFIMRRDGTGLTQITNDAHHDRGPRWSPDGKHIAFYSDRSGEYEIWLITSNGTGLERITRTTEKKMVFYPIWSPDGERLLYRLSGAPSFIKYIAKSEPADIPLSAFDHPTLKFGPWDWSSDGEVIAGTLGSGQTGSRGVALFFLDTNRFRQLVNFGDAPRFLNDNKRLLFYYRGAIYLANCELPADPKKIYSVSPNGMSGFAVSKDNRSIFFSMDSTESDVWLRLVEPSD